MEIFYKEVKHKGKDQKTRLQTDQEFKQKKIFSLNKKFNVDMFLTAVRGGKAFVAEQKLRELKKRIFRLKAMEKRLSKKQNLYEIIKNSVENLNSLTSAKISKHQMRQKKNSLNSEASREEKVRQTKFNKRIYERKN